MLAFDGRRGGLCQRRKIVPCTHPHRPCTKSRSVTRERQVARSTENRRGPHGLVPLFNASRRGYSRRMRWATRILMVLAAGSGACACVLFGYDVHDYGPGPAPDASSGTDAETDAVSERGLAERDGGDGDAADAATTY